MTEDNGMDQNEDQHDGSRELLDLSNSEAREATAPVRENLLHELTAEQLVERAVVNARPHPHSQPFRWVGVKETFALGSTYAQELCVKHGLDPDEVMKSR